MEEQPQLRRMIVIYIELCIFQVHFNPLYQFSNNSLRSVNYRKINEKIVV